MSEMRHERPGVYSVYDASSVTSAGRAAKRIGVAALSVKGTANTAVTLTGYGAGVEIFGEDLADTPGMSTLLKLLFANGASTVYAVRVGAGGGLEAYVMPLFCGIAAIVREKRFTEMSWRSCGT